MVIRDLNKSELRLVYPVAMLACGALIFESVLTRFLAVAQYYHFAFLVVSLALLGYGASGSLLNLFPKLVNIRPGYVNETAGLNRLYQISAVGFASSVSLAYLIVNLLPFDSYSIAWDRKQIVFLGLYYLSLSIPFLFVGLGIGGALATLKRFGNLVYATNLAGSAIGVLIAPGVMWLAGVPGAILTSVLIGLSAGLDKKKQIGPFWRWGLGFTYLAGTILFILFSQANLKGHSPLGMAISPYKGLAQALRVPGSEVLYGRWNAFSRVDVVSGGATKVMPGLSYMYPGNPPRQYGLALDADTLQPVSFIEPDEFDIWKFLPEALAFELRPDADTLVIEPGGGLGILQSLAADSSSTTAVINNGLFVEALAATAGNYNFYLDERVNVIYSSPREYLNQVGDSFDIIYLPLTDSYRPVASGAYSLVETYSLTVEAFEELFGRLSPFGMVVATRWLQTPPSEEVKLVATAIEALGRLEIDSPADKIVAIRGIQTMTLFVQPDGWSKAEQMAAREFSDLMKYDLVWIPDISESDINKHNRLPEPYYFDLVGQLVDTGDRRSIYKSYPFAIEPATDDYPFFFHFFKWGQTSQILATVGHVWQPFGGSGYLVLLALLVLVLVLSLGLIGLPYLMSNRLTNREYRNAGDEKDRTLPLKRSRVLLYYASIGFAFLMIEIPLIQRGILLLGNPTYAFTVVVLVLLLSSSFGSLISRSQKVPLLNSIFLLVGFALLTIWVSGKFISLTLGWELLPKALGFSASLMPLGVLMGVPFPAGLELLTRGDSRLVTWAWAINGCSSVLSSVLAALLALSFGLNMVMLIGAGFYAAAAMVVVMARRDKPRLVLPGKRYKSNPT